MTITGGGTLNGKSLADCVIYVIGTNLTIKDCIVNAKGEYGIMGKFGSEKLLISKATVTAEGKLKWGGIYLQLQGNHAGRLRYHAARRSEI